MSDRVKRKPANQPPVSAHPAFPVIVALWFAALFGIGSMVLPIDLFERFSVASGLAEAYRAAQPPLGATARIAVAAIATLIGAGAGLFVARRVAAAHAPRPVHRRAAALHPASAPMPAKRPISAHEELFEGGLDAADEQPVRAAPGRRRALAVTDDSAPSDFLAFAPLPGRSANDADEPLDLGGFAAREEVVEEPAREAFAEPPEAGIQPEAFGSSALSSPPSPCQAAPFADPAIETTQGTADPASLDEEIAQVAATPLAPLAERPIGDLSVVELVERFALALARHQATADQRVPAPAPEPAPETVATQPPRSVAAMPEPTAGLEPDGAADLPRPSDPPARAELPAALRPFGFDMIDDEADDEAALPDLDLTTALSRVRALAPAPLAMAADLDIREEPEEEPDEAFEDSYPSLLAMKSPLGQREPVRIDDDEGDADAGEPVVVFPGQSARPFDAPMQRAEHPAAATPRPATDPGATERALREALEKLQRMSGAA